MEPNTSSHGTPSSCSITATTSASVIGGTDDCSERSSSTYSGATRSGPRREHLAELAERGSELLERLAELLRCLRVARPAQRAAGQPRTTAGPSTRAISRARPSRRRRRRPARARRRSAPVFTTVTVQRARCVTRLATLPSRNSLRPRMPVVADDEHVGAGLLGRGDDQLGDRVAGDDAGGGAAVRSAWAFSASSDAAALTLRARRARRQHLHHVEAGVVGDRERRGPRDRRAAVPLPSVATATTRTVAVAGRRRRR